METVATDEEKIAHQALKSLHDHTGLSFELLDVNTVLGTGLWPDMRLRISGTKVELISEIKTDIAKPNVLPIVKQLKAAADGRPSLLISDYIDSDAGQALRALNVNYLDAGGNAYINMPPFFVFIDGQANTGSGGRNKPTKPYSHNDLKVIFALLSNPSLLNANYGEIATHSNVALGVCGAVFRDLKDQGYFVESLTTKKREWRARHKLLGHWVAQYPLLRKKHYIGPYHPATKDWWRSEAFRKYDAQLGGRFAVAAYTGSDNASFSSIHLDDQEQWQFIREMHFEKADPQEETIADKREAPMPINVFSKFWGKTEGSAKNPRVTHPLITYADLIDAGDTQSVTVANEILSKHLA